MPDDKIEVQEVKPVTVSKRQAWRIFAGKFIVDFVETLSVSLPVGALFLPASMDDLQKLWLVLSVPVGSSLVSAARRNWPTIRGWLTPENGAAE